MSITTSTAAALGQAASSAVSSVRGASQSSARSVHCSVRTTMWARRKG
ncbi:MAG TPA: hypothetical protein VL049_03540 [Candidatus Dormibacteraeota bacterium]|nr:hypothetical protein [Candidatus Dormibacteraeota bacterium]